MRGEGGLAGLHPQRMGLVIVKVDHQSTKEDDCTMPAPLTHPTLMNMVNLDRARPWKVGQLAIPRGVPDANTTMTKG
jgi:hypothetical protein